MEHLWLVVNDDSVGVASLLKVLFISMAYSKLIGFLNALFVDFKLSTFKAGKKHFHALGGFWEVI
jgi:hypothetical protein